MDTSRETAKRLRDQGQLELAAATLRSVVDNDPDDVPALVELASVLAEVGQRAASENCLRRALTHVKTDFELLVRVGHVYQELRLWTDAACCYERAATMQPWRLEAHISLGAVLSRLGRFAESVACFDRVLRLHPNAPEVLRARARAKAALGEWQEACDAQRAVRRKRSSCLPALPDVVGALSWRPIQQNTRACTLTVISGDRFARSVGVSVYARSLARFWSGDKHIFAEGLSTETCRLFETIGFTVHPVVVTDRLMRVRWLMYWLLLSQSNYDRCLVTDSKDVVFQNNPFDTASSPTGLLLTSEGVGHGESLWNLNQQMGLQSSLGLIVDCREWPVVNGGVQFGSPERLKELSLLMYTNMLTSDPDSSDQAVLNYLYHTVLVFQPGYDVADPATSAFCVTGETLATTKPTAALWQGDAICHPTLGPYSLVHQWERTPFRASVAAAALNGGDGTGSGRQSI